MVETTGTITFKREDISQLESDAIVRKGVAHVPQGRGTFPELTVEDNLRVGAFIRSTTKCKMTYRIVTTPTLYCLNDVLKLLVHSPEENNRCWRCHVH
ncbi:MAG: hypothetical protein CM15mP49_21990 [Actinomycetota bacterium]|nr:MAG: hypothetical protein CM15mP49_21990 [Actinomycetota bacterium]